MTEMCLNLHEGQRLTTASKNYIFSDKTGFYATVGAVFYSNLQTKTSISNSQNEFYQIEPKRRC